MPNVVDEEIEIPLLAISTGRSFGDQFPPEKPVKEIKSQKQVQSLFPLLPHIRRAQQAIPTGAIRKIMRSRNERRSAIVRSWNILQEQRDAELPEAVAMPFMRVGRHADVRSWIGGASHPLDVISSKLDLLSRQLLKYPTRKRIG